MVELQPSKLATWVRFPSPAPFPQSTTQARFFSGAGPYWGYLDLAFSRTRAHHNRPMCFSITRLAIGLCLELGQCLSVDAQIAGIEPGSAAIRICREPLVAARINPMQYGQFVEYLCELVPAMWAEKLYDGGFEGLSAYHFEFIKQSDFKEKPWYPSGAVNRGRYTLDKTTKVGGAVSQKIEVEGAD